MATVLPALTKLASWLMGYDTVAVAPIVQPHLASVPGVWYEQGHQAIPPITVNGFTTATLTAPPVGYAEPDQVHVYGTPPSDFVPGGTSTVFENDAIGGGYNG